MRTILHCDLNNFYASVECLRHPEYKDSPVIVSGNPEKRHGIVLAKNMPAKRACIRTGETIWQAQIKCPNLVCLPPHFEDYMRLSEQIFKMYTGYTDRVEAFGPDECWLDVTGSRRLLGDGVTIADDIRRRVREETGLTVSVGVSWNKIFAKLGSDLKKPDATSVLMPDGYDAIVRPLPVGDMFMIGPATVRALAQMNISTIGDLADADPAVLIRRFGKNGAMMSRYARGEDDDPVRLYYAKRVPESVGHGITTTRDLDSHEDLRVVSFFLADKIAKRLRKGGFTAGRIAIDLRDANLEHVSRQCALPYPTDSATVIGQSAYELAAALFTPGESVPIRTVTVSTFALGEIGAARQASLFEPTDYEKEHRLGKTLDELSSKFGRDSVRRALSLGNDFVYDKSDSEDFLPFKR